MEKFVLIGRGTRDCNNRSMTRLTPSCYEKVYELRCATGLSMGRIVEQCVDFALEHLDCRPYGLDCDRGFGRDCEDDSLPLQRTGKGQKGGRKHG